MAFSISDRCKVLHQAWPIIIANASVPLLGLVDTAVIGHMGNATSIGALAISNMIFNFIYWAFGFFRMSTTGFIAQARGAGDMTEAQAVFVRSLVLAFLCGCALVAMQTLIAKGAFGLLNASAAVERVAQQYYAIRIWGAPATLALYGVMGVCIGFGKTRLLLLIQLGMNITNIILDIVFALLFQLGVVGIAVGTLVAEWGTLLIASACVYRVLFGSIGIRRLLAFRSYFSGQKLTALFSVNSNIFIRTFFLLVGFAWFTDASAQYGDVILASNHILLLFISFSAFFLDGFAFVAEEKVGAAKGGTDWPCAKRSIYLTSELAVATALLLSIGVFIFAHYGLHLITDSTLVQQQIQEFLPWACLYIIVSVAAFQLDGIFIGATLSVPMRNASLLSFVFFITFDFLLTPRYGVHGLWLSFIIFVIARGACLGSYWSVLIGSFHLSRKTY